MPNSHVGKNEENQNGSSCDARGRRGLRARADADFAAAFAEREDFARVQRAIGIEGVVDTAHEIEVGVGEK